MFSETRTLSEVLSIFELEPTLKNVYVEGLSDVYIIENYLQTVGISDISIYHIDSVDFEEEYKALKEEEVTLLKKNNKERVCHLASLMNSIKAKEEPHTICVVDVDFDLAKGIDRRSNLLAYTDYNAIELYFFSLNSIRKTFQQLLHIPRPNDIDNFMLSLSEVCRKLFFIHFILDQENVGMIDFQKDLSFDKATYTCSLDFDKYWEKSITNNKLKHKEGELHSLYVSKYNDKKLDVRLEMRGHTLMELLYFFCKKIKTSMKMNSDEFGSSALLCLDYQQLQQEALFQKIAAI